MCEKIEKHTKNKNNLVQFIEKFVFVTEKETKILVWFVVGFRVRVQVVWQTTHTNKIPDKLGPLDGAWRPCRCTVLHMYTSFHSDF